MILAAPAKINLFLKVTGKRDDGYHELETWMQKLTLSDTLRLRVTDNPSISFSCTSREVPANKSNLVWRAAELFLQKSRRARNFGVEIHLEKKIPVAAGLGGGSSDAGITLRGLNSYFDNEFSQQELEALALSLGADVPFFVSELESTLARGVGEIMVPAEPLRDCCIVLVNPGINVSTAEVFANFALTKVEKNSTLTGSRKLHAEGLSIDDLQNDLEIVTVRQYPVIADIKRELKRLGAISALMSGSGPTVFGIFPNSAKNANEIVNRAVLQLKGKFGEKVYTTQSRVGV